MRTSVRWVGLWAGCKSRRGRAAGVMRGGRAMGGEEEASTSRRGGWGVQRVQRVRRDQRTATLSVPALGCEGRPLFNGADGRAATSWMPRGSRRDTLWRTGVADRRVEGAGKMDLRLSVMMRDCCRDEGELMNCGDAEWRRLKAVAERERIDLGYERVVQPRVAEEGREGKAALERSRGSSGPQSLLLSLSTPTGRPLGSAAQSEAELSRAKRSQAEPSGAKPS
jgi:hypothetical protein